MSIISTTPVLNGVVATAAAANATYTAIATGTATLDSNNTQTEWVSQEHVDTTTNDAVWTTDMGTFCNSTLTYTLSSETHVTINLGGTTPVRINFSPNLIWERPYELLRIHADINLDDVIGAGEDPVGDIVLPAFMNANNDTFFLKLYYLNNANVWVEVSTCEWGYSVTNFTDFDTTAITAPPHGPTDASVTLRQYALTHPTKRMRCSISGFLTNVANGIKAVELRARVADNATLVGIVLKEATMVCAMVRN